MRVEDRFRDSFEGGNRSVRKEVLFYALIAALVFLTLALVIAPGLAAGA